MKLGILRFTEITLTIPNLQKKYAQKYKPVYFESNGTAMVKVGSFK